MAKNLLDYFFKPESVAVVGASSLEGQVGRIILDNLREGGFPGEIFPVTPEAPEVVGLKAYASLTAVARPVDLVVICTPVETAPTIIKECGAIGTKAAIIVSAGNEAPGEDGAALLQAIHEESQKAGVRCFGPDCMGMLCPASRVNASLAAFSAKPGSLAFVSQSGSMGSAILGWATQNNIGFSHFISVGTMADLDLADLLDYLGSETSAKSILIYMESMTSARPFMSAARAVSRIKPIIISKSNRREARAQATASTFEAMTRLDQIYNASFRRSGIVRVDTVRQLFDCAEALGKAPKPVGGGLGIITNAGGQDSWPLTPWENGAWNPRSWGRRPWQSSMRCCRVSGTTATRWTSWETPTMSAISRRCTSVCKPLNFLVW